MDYVLDKIDVVLLMSVNPGFGGQKFIPGTLAKARQARAKLDAYEKETGRRIRLEIDGGRKRRPTSPKSPVPASMPSLPVRPSMAPARTAIPTPLRLDHCGAASLRP
jgi:hypothetical protein